MTAACPSFPRTHSNPFPLVLVGILVLLVGLASVHAVIRHGEAAITAQRCFGGEGQTMREVYEDPLNGRQMSFCNHKGNWYVSIDAADGGNVTMFPRSFARCLRDVIDYAKRSGFTRSVQLH